MPLAERLKKKIEYDTNGGCWLWAGPLFQKAGYGALKVGKKNVAAHRLAWQVWRGEIPEGDGYHGICICHRCDIRACINPDHLFLGTHVANIADKTLKGRCSSRLSRDDIPKIRQRLANGETASSIAFDFGVARRTISHVATGYTWTHVPQNELT